MSARLAPQSALAPMRCEDIDELLAIEESLYTFPWSRANFADSIASGYSVCGCRAAGELIGYFVLLLAVGEAHLLNIGVAEEWQGMGEGGELRRQALRLAQRAGALSVLLEVRPSNVRALALYARFGFEQIGQRRGYYPAADRRQEALVLRRLAGAGDRQAAAAMKISACRLLLLREGGLTPSVLRAGGRERASAQNRLANRSAPRRRRPYRPRRHVPAAAQAHAGGAGDRRLSAVSAPADCSRSAARHRPARARRRTRRRR